jgi:mannosylglucosylglycerate synthase
VSIEATKWQWALGQLGFTTVTVAGDGPVDRPVDGLSIGAPEPPDPVELASALDDADLVVVENLCSLPLNRAALAATAATLKGRPAILHHHDLPWQRPQFLDDPAPPVDHRWRHVTINQLSRGQLAQRGIAATTIYNSFDLAAAGGATPGRSGPRDEGGRREVRRAVGVDDDRRLVLQPTRAIPRKNVAGGLRVATELGGVYWLLGPAEDGYGPELADLVAGAECPVVLGSPDGMPSLTVHEAYRACDVVTLPSTWEGFGNPTIESVAHRRPLAIGPYPVAQELLAFGFDWFALEEMERLGSWLTTPDAALLDHNLEVAAAHFSLADLPAKIAAVVPEL